MNKIKITTGLAIIAIISTSLYASYKFYSKSVKTIEVTADTFNIDSLRSNYESQIKNLEDKLSDKDVIINQRTNENLSLRKNYDSVNNKLWYYKSKIKSDTVK